jgi:RNA polymerase sigma factor (sigma-70 family)
VAVQLVSEGSAAFKATARRYSICSADADDAYQRGLEILITKAPTSQPSELKPWLHTVIKHEALAVRRQRERLLSPGGEIEPNTASAERGPEDGTAERERATQTAAALRELKRSEVQCLLLKALGYSYAEISQRTGFSWTKVNRSLTEGRRRFFDAFADIESGRRCASFRPLLSAASDGEASAEQERLLAAHLRGCHSCRAALRGYRAVPGRIAELLPPAALAPLLGRDGWWSRLYDALSIGGGERAAAFGHKLQQAGDIVTGQKAAAVVATTAALAGGAAVHDRAAHRAPHGSRSHALANQSQVEPAAETRPAPAVPDPRPAPAPPVDEPFPRSAEGPSTVPAGEFTPEAAATNSTADESAVVGDASGDVPVPGGLPVSTSPASPARGRGSGTGSASGEFGP